MGEYVPAFPPSLTSKKSNFRFVCNVVNSSLVFDHESIMSLISFQNDVDDINDITIGNNDSSKSSVASNWLASQFFLTAILQQQRWVSTCSLDHKVQAHLVVGAINKSGRPPSPPVGSNDPGKCHWYTVLELSSLALAEKQ